jgi:hypothetical protein
MSRTEILHGWLSISKPIRPGWLLTESLLSSMNALHGVFRIPLAGVAGGLCADREPELGLRASHHELQIIGRLAGGHVHGEFALSSDAARVRGI